MREWRVSQVVAEGCDTQYLSPVNEKVLGCDLREKRPGLLVQIFAVCDGFEGAPGELHHAERMLEALMCCARIDEVRQRELVDMAQR